MTKNEEQRIRKILTFMARGKSCGNLGKIYHCTRQNIFYLFKRNMGNPKFASLYREIARTQKFLNRKLE